MNYFFKIYLTKVSLFFLTFLFSLIAFAQDTTLATTTTTSTATSIQKTWYMEPWAWVLSGLLLLIIIIIATRGNGSKTPTNKVTVTRTIEKNIDRV